MSSNFGPSGNGAAVGSAQITDGSIVNADVNTSAAIAGTKIDPTFGSQNISNTGRSQLGSGAAMGAPTGTPTLVEGAAGNVTGTVRYAYYEIDPVGSGKTTLSPYGEITVTNKQVAVTIPLPRKGAGGRVLCRTKAASTATYYILQNIGGDFYTTFTDNVADASLGAAVTDTDTTALYYLDIRPDVKFVRSHPTDAATADWTFATGGPGTAGAYAIDSYGSVTSRGTPLNPAFIAKAYDTADIFKGETLAAEYGSAAATKFRVRSTGTFDFGTDNRSFFCQDATPTANATDDLWYETDTNILWYWNGTYWLTVQTFQFQGTADGIGAGATLCYAWPQALTAIAANVYLMDLVTSYYVATTNNGTNYWTTTLRRRAADNTITNISSLNTSANAVNNFVTQSVAVNTHLNLTTGIKILDISTSITLVPGTLNGSAVFTYKWAHN